MTELLGYFGLALLLAGLPVLVGATLKASRRVLLATLATSLFVLLMPWNGHSIIYYIRGVAGDLSMSGLMLLILLFARHGGWNLFQNAGAPWQSAAIIMGLLVPLYASTLGYWSYDLYACGYQPQLMLAGVGVLLAWSWWRQKELAIAWLVGTSAFALGICPSANLWDALFDPFMLIGSLAVLLRSALVLILPVRSNISRDNQQFLRRAA